MHDTTDPIPSTQAATPALATSREQARHAATRDVPTGGVAQLRAPPYWQRDALADLPIWRCDVATGKPELPALLLAVWLPERTRTWEWEVIDPRGDTSMAEGGSDSQALARAAAEAWTRLRFGDVLDRG